MPASPPNPTPCPTCGGERLLADVGNNVRLVRHGTRLPGLSGPTTECWALVCEACGQAMLFAKDPAVLRR